MLTGLKVLSLASKFVFYRPEHNAKGRPHGIEFWRSWNANISTDRAHNVDEKNGTICLVIMFTLKVMFIKMSKKWLILVFSADDRKKLVTFWAKYISASERSY